MRPRRRRNRPWDVEHSVIHTVFLLGYYIRYMACSYYGATPTYGVQRTAWLSVECHFHFPFYLLPVVQLSIEGCGKNSGTSYRMSSGLRQRRPVHVLPSYNSPLETQPKSRKPSRSVTLVYALPLVFLIILLLHNDYYQVIIKRLRLQPKSVVLPIHRSVLDAEIMNSYTTFVTCEDLSRGILNDDYCDCPSDGRDEPNTSACSGTLAQKASFRCKDGRLFLFPSRVGDGIKDCSDGSDEWSYICVERDDCSSPFWILFYRTPSDRLHLIVLTVVTNDHIYALKEPAVVLLSNLNCKNSTTYRDTQLSWHWL
jgi:hypothetical protein